MKSAYLHLSFTARRPSPGLALGLMAALAVAACGGDDSASPGPQPPALKCTDPQVADATAKNCVTPVVNTVTPAQAYHLETFDLVLTGQNLPEDLVVALPGCAFAAKAGGSRASRSYTCTPSQIGDLAGSVKSKGGAILKSFNLTVLLRPLNDTGVTPQQCFQAGSNVLVDCANAAAKSLNAHQDGMIGLDASFPDSTDGKLGFQYTKIGADGAALPNGAASWSCVKDKVTGLMWEVKQAQGGASLRAGDKIYTNKNDANDPADAAGFVKAVNAQGLCGASDWRLPGITELEGLTDHGLGSAVPRINIDRAWFPNTLDASYWSSTADTSGVYMWFVDFSQWGQQGTDPQTNSYAVRLVRGAIGQPAVRFEAVNNGAEVKDHLTGLVWQRCAAGMNWDGSTCAGTPSAYTHDQALAWAKTQTGWRLPNIKELASIADRSRSSPAIDGVFSQANVAGWNYWSSTPGLDGTAARADYAMVVSFDNGSIVARERQAGVTGPARLVRVTQP